jgi:hypothetical protein
VATGLLANALERHNAAALQGPIEYRFPWLDLRVIEACWSIPPPLRFAKYLLRSALEGQLPESILGRRKTGLAGDLLLASERNLDISWNRYVRLAPQAMRYVCADPIKEFRRTGCPGIDSHSAWLHTRPLELCSWLQHRAPGVDSTGQTATRMKILYLTAGAAGMFAVTFGRPGRLRAACAVGGG